MLKYLICISLLYITTAQATSIVCKNDTSKHLTTLAKIEITKASERTYYEISIPKTSDGFELTDAFILIGTEEHPIITFSLQLEFYGSKMVGGFTTYKDIGAIYLHAKYGKTCEGFTLWQNIEA